MATPIIRIQRVKLNQADQERMTAQIKERLQKDGILVLDDVCELLGVIQDDGTFMPYLPDATYVLPESKAVQVGG